MGTYYHPSTQSCVACPLGTYQNDEAQENCKKCPAGKVTVATKSRDLGECVGKYNFVNMHVSKLLLGILITHMTSTRFSYYCSFMVCLLVISDLPVGVGMVLVLFFHLFVFLCVITSFFQLFSVYFRYLWPGAVLPHRPGDLPVVSCWLAPEQQPQLVLRQMPGWNQHAGDGSHFCTTMQT